jgi:hypothetical protein
MPQQSPQPASRLVSRVKRFYATYAPEKLEKLEFLLPLFREDEEAAFAQLVRKYGPEPSADTRTRVTAFYTYYAPEKLHSEVESTISRFSGRKDLLFEMLERRFGPEPLHPQFRSRVEHFYRVHAPARLNDLSKLLPMMVGHEEESMLKLVAKYGPEPPSDDRPGPTGAEEPQAASVHKDGGGSSVVEAPNGVVPLRSGTRERLVRFYAAHAPSKLDDVDRLLPMIAGLEDETFEKLVAKYGPEPPSDDRPGPTGAEEPHSVAEDLETPVDIWNLPDGDDAVVACSVPLEGLVGWRASEMASFENEEDDQVSKANHLTPDDPPNVHGEFVSTLVRDNLRKKGEEINTKDEGVQHVASCPSFSTVEDIERQWRNFVSCYSTSINEIPSGDSEPRVLDGLTVLDEWSDEWNPLQEVLAVFRLQRCGRGFAIRRSLMCRTLAQLRARQEHRRERELQDIRDHGALAHAKAERAAHRYSRAVILEDAAEARAARQQLAASRQAACLASHRAQEALLRCDSVFLQMKLELTEVEQRNRALLHRAAVRQDIRSGKCDFGGRDHVMRILQSHDANLRRHAASVVIDIVNHRGSEFGEVDCVN